MSKVSLVTGAAAGIGAAIARELAQRGDAVVVADIDRTNGEAVVAELQTAGHRAMFVELNVTQRADWERARDEVTAAFGSVDVLVNNAGVFRDRTLLKLSDDDWDRVLDVNLKSAWLGMQVLIPGMKAKKWGRIVNVSSSAHRGSFGQSNYSAAKGGLVSLTRSAAIESVKSGILINAIAPHNVDTQLLQKVAPELRAEWIAKSRFGRFLEPAEVAAVVEFLASPRNAVVTGQLLEIDGGDIVGLP
jgi:3-oxoacyl-[acyl-carrier protein] reductase